MQGPDDDPVAEKVPESGFPTTAEVVARWRPNPLVDRLYDDLGRTLDRLRTYLPWDSRGRRVFEDRGLVLVPSGFYYPIPTLEDIEDSWEYRTEMPFLDETIFDRALLAAELERLMPFAAEFNPPEEGDLDHPAEYAWNMSIFGWSDAIAYYSILRERKPRRVIEIGSGFSTLIATQAMTKNGSGEVICVEPYPRAFLHDLDITLVEQPVEVLAVDWFNDNLGPGDVLFIDSTHVVKTGSDCVYLYLKLLPELRNDLLIHVHDVHAPGATPKSWLVTHHLYWTEHYLLLAYLIENPRTRVLYGSVANALLNRELLEEMMGGKTAIGGGSLWFEQAGREPAER